jgi:hypothetical protein
MKNITLSIASAILFATVAIIPISANACSNGCYGNSYGYSYGNQGTYYSPSYTYSQGGMNYPYQSPTRYSPSYYVQNGGYNYNYSSSYPTYRVNYPTSYYNYQQPRSIGPEQQPQYNSYHGR